MSNGFFNTSAETQRRLAVVSPLLALWISMLIVYPRWQDYKQLRPQVEARTKLLADLKAAKVPEDAPGTPAVPATRTEAPEYMGQINTIATASGCRIGAEDLKFTDPGTATGSVKAVRSQITVVGKYRDIRRFVAEINASPRVFAISDITVVPYKDPLIGQGVQGTIEIERYTKIEQ